MKIVLLVLSFIHWPFGFLPLPTGLADDMVGFVSFEDTSVWDNVYRTTCARRTYDLFREPRVRSNPNHLRAPLEALSPVKIHTKEAINTTQQSPIHLYSNPGVRRAYSVSYGFSKDKECIHGEDEDCIVNPAFGKTRAVVVSAIRYKKGQDLNYIKDHYLIEEQEKFVTILNGASDYERKFYEAVFLGGYPDPKDPTRSTHQIDGKSYPMEIYMYFMDETVPALALTTILVVLVEESDRDNPFAKPIVTAINNELYNAERQYFEGNKGLTRRARLFHHLDPSTRYDIGDVETRTKTRENYQLEFLPLHEQTIVQDTILASFINENSVMSILETFEKTQAEVAKLYFNYEDLKDVSKRERVFTDLINEYNNKLGNRYFPMFSEFLNRLFFVGVYAGVGFIKNNTCEESTRVVFQGDNATRKLWGLEKYGVPPVSPLDPTSAHFKAEWDLSVDICKEMKKHNSKTSEIKMSNVTHNMTWNDKYDEYIGGLIEIRKRIEILEERVHQHIFNKEYNHVIPADQDGNIDDSGTDEALRYEKTRTFVTGLTRIILDVRKRNAYRARLAHLKAFINRRVQGEDFVDENTMKEVIHFVKYGSKQRKLKHSREKFVKATRGYYMPQHHKKRGPVEMGNMEMDQNTIKFEDSLSPVKALINQAFQISWLIPPDGGYYHYEGSSPLPPCFRAQNVIVFKRPIHMSKYQIETLTRIPISFNKYHDIRSTMPLVHDLKFTARVSGEETESDRHQEVEVPVYHERRNHLFLGHDGVHKNSVEESEKWEAAQNRLGAAGRMYFSPAIPLLPVIISALL